VLQGLIFASTVAVSTAVTDTINGMADGERRRTLIPRYWYTAATVAITLLAAQTILKDPLPPLTPPTLIMMSSEEAPITTFSQLLSQLQRPQRHRVR